MARSLPHALTTLRIQSFTHICRPLPLSNNYSSSHNRLPKNELTEDASSEALIRKLEDAIHLIIARRSAPDWLPFMPGSSYWVPPINSKVTGMELPVLLADLTNHQTLSPQEYLSTTTARGWPSYSYFTYGGSPHPLETEITSSSSFHSEEDEEE